MSALFWWLHLALLLTLVIHQFIVPNYLGLEDDDWIKEDAREKLKAKSKQVSRRCFWINACLLPACALYDVLIWRHIPAGVWVLIAALGIFSAWSLVKFLKASD